MRAYLTINAKNNVIPFDHRDLITQSIMAWLKWENKQEKLPPFSFSRFEGIKFNSEGIWFNNETAFFFSSPNAELVKKLEAGVKANPKLFMGLKVTEIKLLEDPDLSKRELFYAASPLLIQPTGENQTDYIVYNDQHADAILKEHTIRKLKAAGINDETFDITFDKNYANAGIKKITYNGMIMRASWCQIIIKSKAETKQYVWHTGLGNFTQIGFGAIM